MVGFLRIILRQLFLFLMKNMCCDQSLDQSHKTVLIGDTIYVSMETYGKLSVNILIWSTVLSILFFFMPPRIRRIEEGH